MYGTFDFLTGNDVLRPNPWAAGGVQYMRRDLINYLTQYSLIDDCIAGEQRIKSRRSEYLTLPGDMSDPDMAARYTNYLSRAVFYGVAGRTLEGYVGKVFTRDAVVKAPGVLELVVDDVNGEGVSLDQLTQKAVATVLAKGRAGVFIDYPVVEGGASAADLATGKVKPIISLFQPQQIINWQTARVGSKERLTLVVLAELYTQPKDQFASEQQLQYRELRLVDGIYHSTIWRQKAGATTGFEVYYGPVTPLNSQGKPYDELPFRFIGPRESSSVIEKPPMYDLCSINIAHYRNSADYEEACFVTGQPTVWASGLTQQWVKEVLGGKVLVGARGILPLPVNAAAGLLQVEPNIMPMEAMKHKEAQMIALGAKLIEPRQVQRTATEADMDEEAESSVLSSVSRNVSKCMKWALQWGGYFVGINESAIDFQLNTDFDLATLSPQERQQLISEWQAEAITFPELRANLRKAGIATLTDEEALRQLETDRMNFAPEVEPGEEDEDPEDKPPAK